MAHNKHQLNLMCKLEYSKTAVFIFHNLSSHLFPGSKAETPQF